MKQNNILQPGENIMKPTKCSRENQHVRKVEVVYDPEHVLHRGANTSAETPERIDVIVKCLGEHGILVNKYEAEKRIERKSLKKQNCCFCTSEMIVGEKRCPICESKQTHEWEYTEDVKGDTTFETPYTTMIIERARRMILEAAQEAMKRNFTLCLSRPPGHHSCSDKKRKGFCHANFVIDALDSFHNSGLRAVIIDIDAHHGDGTEHDVLERSYGYYTSIHGFGPNVYPGTGNSCESERILNIPLEKNANTERWLSVWREKCIPFVKSKSPDILLLSCGLDAH